MIGYILAALILATAPASGQQADSPEEAFSVADVNGNERVSEREYLHFQELLLLMADQDGDGRLSALEWKDWDPREFVGPLPGTVGSLVAAMASRFVAYDWDKDDFLSQEEFSAGMFTPFDKTGAGPRGMDPREFREAFLLPEQLKR